MSAAVASPSKGSGTIRVGYLGSEGTYSEDAQRSFFSQGEWRRYNVKAEGAKTVRTIFERVKSGELAYGVVPLENSISGTLYSVYELLLEHSKSVFIVGECAVEELHCICVKSNSVEHTQITQVLSHHAALEQCRTYLTQKLPSTASRRITPDTVSAAIEVAASDKPIAAICSKRAALLHKLHVLDEGISSTPATRYIVISANRADVEDISNKLKVSVAVSLPNVAGALFKTTACFALRDINVSKFECQPAQASRLLPSDAFESQSMFWKYLFYIDFEPGGLSQAKAALSNLREFAREVVELGIYNRNDIEKKQSVDPDWTSYL